MAAWASLSFVPVTMVDQLAVLSCESSRLLAEVPAHRPVRNAIKTTSTASGTNAGSAGAEATAAAASVPVQNPIAQVRREASN